MAQRFINPFPTYFDGDKTILAGGTIEFTEKGTEKEVAVYTDDTARFNSKNPVPLNGAGRATAWLNDGDYRVRLKNKNGAQIAYFAEYIVEPELSANDYLPQESYSINEVVKSNDNLLYVSLIDDNMGLLPQDNSSAWTHYSLVRLWNTEESYSEGNLVQYLNRLYVARTSNNVGNIPLTSDNDWLGQGTAGHITKRGFISVDSGVPEDTFIETGFEPRFIELSGVFGQKGNNPYRLYATYVGYPNSSAPGNKVSPNGTFYQGGGSAKAVSNDVGDSSIVYDNTLFAGGGTAVGGKISLKSRTSNGFTIAFVNTSIFDLAHNADIMWTAKNYGPGLDEPIVN